MASPHVRSNGAAGPRPQLPAFCRSRRPVVTVSVSSLNALRLLVLLGLLFQLSTLLVVIAGPVPPRPVISSSHDFRPDAVSSAAGVPLLQPLSDR
jgi:hypothetical protein